MKNQMDEKIFEIFKEQYQLGIKNLQTGQIKTFLEEMNIDTTRQTVIRHLNKINRDFAGIEPVLGEKGGQAWALTELGLETYKIASPIGINCILPPHPVPLSNEEMLILNEAVKEVYSNRYSEAKIIIGEPNQVSSKFQRHPIDNKPRVYVNLIPSNRNNILTISPFAMRGNFSWGKEPHTPSKYNFPSPIIVSKIGRSFTNGPKGDVYPFKLTSEIFLPTFNVDKHLFNDIPTRFEGFTMNFLSLILDRITKENGVNFSSGLFSVSLSPKIDDVDKISPVSRDDIITAITGIYKSQEDVEIFFERVLSNFLKMNC